MNLPLLLEADLLHSHLREPKLLIVDLCSEKSYAQGHIPGAVHVNTADLISGEKPAPGLLPTEEKIDALFSGLDLTPDTQIVCYDDEGGPWAGRFIWTLDLIGHTRTSFLNGGLIAWQAAGLPLESGINTRKPVNHHYSLVADKNISTEQLLNELKNNTDLLIWDARSAEEYRGEKVLSQRGGHIPGAIHCEWTQLLSGQKKLRADLQAYLQSQGITPEKHIVTHCQTHRRSGLTYMAAKILGYPNIRAYAGSWSEWGNRTDTPVEL